MNPEKTPKPEDYRRPQDIADEKKRLQREAKTKETAAAIKRRTTLGSSLEVPVIEQVRNAIDYTIENDTSIVEEITSSSGVLNDKAAIDRSTQIINDLEDEYGLKLDEEEKATMITYAKISFLQAAKDAQVHKKREAQAG